MSRKKPKPQDKNYQDKFADAEFKKGFKTGSKFSTMEKTLKAKDCDNDPGWYYKDEKILKDVASFSYAHPLGMRMDWFESANYPTSVLSPRLKSIPGLLAMEIAPVPGISVDAQSPVNLAAQDLYSFVRYKNSGASNYDPTDLMMYILAMDSLYSAWNWMKRIYGYASQYSAINKYKPRAYAAAESVDLDDIYNHLADFRAFLNMAANRISAFAVPAIMTYNIRHAWLFANIFKDAETNKAQEYMYVPSFFYRFEETASDQGSSLTPIPVIYNESESEITKTWTFEALTNLLNTMINALQYSEDVGIMSGDIIKAYGSALFKISTFEPDYIVQAAYSRDVLSQIENAHLIRRLDTPITQFNIVQNADSNVIQFQPTYTRGTTEDEYPYYINFHWNDVTPQDVIVATRLNVTGVQTANGFQLMSCGSELFFRATMFSFSYTASQPGVLVKTPLQFGFNNTVSELERLIAELWLWGCFDWAPRIPAVVEDETTDETMWISPPMGDWDVFTALSKQNVAALNELALLTEFNVPN